jgi:5-hydroxyisourate hydrolase-like protein (transthyretin family)
MRLNRIFLKCNYIFSISIVLIVFFVSGARGSELPVQQEGRISALVIDQSTKAPIKSASVALLDQTTKKMLKTTQTDAKGVWNMTGVAAGIYTIQVAYMGYSRISMENLKLEAGQQLALGTLEMQVSGEMIEEVVIEASTPSMQLGIDRKIFNVAESTISVGGNAIDLLTNIPSLQVDMDGSIELRGSSNVKVLIDGKESSMAGSDVSHLLRALPAGSIERVELITNPSSRYDAEGQSGIRRFLPQLWCRC